MAPMNYIQVEDLHKGVNLQDDPSSMAEGECVDSIGWDLSVAGELKTLSIHGTHDLTTNVVDGCYDFKIEYLNGARYVIQLAEPGATAIGLYINGVLKATEGGAVLGSLSTATDGQYIYIWISSTMLTGLYSKAFSWDGTTLRYLGITAPASTAVPTITAKAQSTKALEDCEATTGWTADNCTLTASSTYARAGTNSIQIAPSAGTFFHAYKAWSPVKNFTVFDDSATATEKDYFCCSIVVDGVSDIYQLDISLYSSSFTTDHYKYTVSLTSEDTLRLEYGSGGTIPVPMYGFAMNRPAIGSTAASQPAPATVEDPGVSLASLTPQSGSFRTATSNYYSEETKVVTIDDTPPYTADLGSTGTITPTTTELTTGAPAAFLTPKKWMDLKIPLKLFTKIGSPPAWSAIGGVSFAFQTGGTALQNVYLDNIKLAGGGGLTGNFYFMYGWARTNTNGEVIHYSAPARNSTTRALTIQGPITFDRQQVSYGTRVASGSSYVNACVIYILGESLNTWWVGSVITNNTTASGSVDIDLTTLNKRMVSLRNEPLRTGALYGELTWYQNRLWATGWFGSPNLIKFSEISQDGDIMPEAWPTSNAIRIGGKGARILDMVELNRRLVIRTTQGEYALTMQDPTDPTSITVVRTADFGAVQPNQITSSDRETYMKLAGTMIYPTLHGWVQTDGSNPKLMSPKFKNITASGYTATYYRGTFKTYEGYMPYYGYTGYPSTPTALVNRLIKFDFLSGEPRVYFVSDSFWRGVQYDPVVNKTYGLLRSTGDKNTIKLIESSAPDGTTTVNFTSRGYRHPTGQRAVWKRMVFYCDTGGTSYTLTVTVYVDGVEMGNRTFAGASGSRTEIRYDFGPFPGEFFQFKFSGTLSAAVTIYMPIRIHVDAAN